jgi:RimJ/RimL family protein N-acetyltransferase
VYLLLLFLSIFAMSVTIPTDSTFTFKKPTEDDIPLLFSWLQQPHVQKWWPTLGKEELFDHFLKRIRSKETFPFLVILDEIPIGYIQYYYINKHEEKAGKWLPDLPKHTIGFDQFIGDSEYLGKGLGTVFIKKFMSFVNIIEPNVTTFIVDPDPENHAAIRCYEKVGFSKKEICQSPWGSALLMMYKIKD